jgi:quaternary ammonium compound-resistance protein SugE
MTHFFSVSPVSAAWLIVVMSGVLEVVFSVSMKYSDGYSRPFPSALSICSGILSVWLMSTTLKVLPVGTAYAVWAGIGAVGTVLVGVIWLGEPATMLRFACIGLIVLGIVGLQLQSGA